MGNLDPNVDERMLFDTFMAFGTLAQTANVICSLCSPDHPADPIADLLIRSNVNTDIERHNNGSVKRLWIYCLRYFRSCRCGDRVDEFSIPHEQASHSWLCIQEGWKGRTSRYTRRTITRRSGSKEQRSADTWSRRLGDVEC